MGIDLCNQTERLNLMQLFGTKRDMDIKPLYTYLCPVIIFICFFSIIFNAILMSISRQSKVVNKSPILLLSLNLAVTDLIASLLNGLGILFNSYLPEVYDIKMGQCSMLMFEVVRYAALVASALHLLALAFVHYRGIVNPLHYRSTIFFSQHLSRTINIISIVCWIIPLTIMIVWFSSSPCQGFQSAECDYLFLLGFTFRYMVLTLFALPLLLMSAIYLRIFIIISRHQKGRRINHERSALTRGAISAAGPLVTAAAVNLPELITNRNLAASDLGCAACASRATGGGGGGGGAFVTDEMQVAEDEPTIFILSEETGPENGVDHHHHQAAGGKPQIAGNSSSDAASSSSKDLEPQDPTEGGSFGARVTDKLVRVKLESEEEGDDDGQDEDDEETSENKLSDFIETEDVGDALGAGERRRPTTGRLEAGHISTAAGQTVQQAKVGPRASKSSKLDQPEAICDYGSGENRTESGCGRLEPLNSSSNQEPRRRRSRSEEGPARGKPDDRLCKRGERGNARRGFILVLKRMITGRGASSRGMSSPLVGHHNTATLGSIAATNELLVRRQQQQHDQSKLVILNNLKPSPGEIAGTVGTSDKSTTKQEEKGDPLHEGGGSGEGSGLEFVGRPLICDSGESEDQVGTLSVDSEFQPNALGQVGRTATLPKGERSVFELAEGEVDERAELVATLIGDGKRLDTTAVEPMTARGEGSSRSSNERRRRVALKAQCSLGSIGISGRSSTLGKEVRLLPIPNSSGRVLLKESTFHASAKQLSFERGANDQASQQTNPSARPWECTCDNKSRQFNTKLSRSNTIGGASRALNNASQTSSAHKTVANLSDGQRPAIAFGSLKYHLHHRQATASCRSQADTNSVNTTTPSISTYEPQRRHIHASAIPQTNTKALVTTLLILGTYLISYVPAIIFQALTCTDKCPYPLYDISFSRRVLLGAMTNLLLIAKSIIDPFIYSYRMSEIQMAIGRYLSKRRSKTSFANSVHTSQRFNNRSFHNSNYHKPATNSQHSQHHHHHHHHHQHHQNHHQSYH